MADLDDIRDATDANALGPQSATVDGNTVTKHSIADQIALEKHRAAQIQARSATKLIFNKISPPGAA